MKKTIDARGDKCPVPIIKTKKAFEKMNWIGTVEITVDNEITVQNLQKMAKQKKIKSAYSKNGDGDFAVVLTSENEVENSTDEEDETKLSVSGNTVVLLGSDRMGSSDDKLGHVLLKAFIYALVELDTAPSAVIMYNTGVKLSTEVEDSIKDLKTLEKKGTKILSCGTCLNYYKLTEKLAVGSVTNMYAIAETMMNADKIIKP